MHTVLAGHPLVPAGAGRLLAARAYAPVAAMPPSKKNQVDFTSYRQFPLSIGNVAVWWVKPETV
jgi:hypothetical protein